MFIQTSAMTASIIKILTVVQLFTLMNTARVDNGLEALTYNEKLASIAKDRVEMIIEQEKVAHCSGNELIEFAKKHKYSSINFSLNSIHIGENISISYETDEEAFNAFMNSPTHKANILDKDYSEVGYYKGNFKGGTLIVVIFGGTKIND